ncbi:MAG: hypothetical protein U9Q69_04960 [Nanoarchaeota archaeon]|nr:hypothetical protein [Nanoarchaeota archaeon]
MKKLYLVFLLFCILAYPAAAPFGDIWGMWAGQTPLANMQSAGLDSGMQQGMKTIPLSQMQTCVDTDVLPFFPQGKRSFAKKGIVVAAKIDEEGELIEYQFVDTCIDDKTLVEYYCDIDNSVKQNKVYCAGGCLNGKCPNPPFCIDTDKNDNLFVKGKLFLLNIVHPGMGGLSASDAIEKFEDYCFDPRLVAQFKCDDSAEGFAMEIEKCVWGCMDGACIVGESAEDTPAVADDIVESPETMPKYSLTNVQQGEDNVQQGEEIILIPGQKKIVNGVALTLSLDMNSIQKEF